MIDQMRKLLGMPPLDPKANVPNRTKRQVVPEKLVQHVHELCMLTRVNVGIGYEIDDTRNNWDELYANFRIALNQLVERSNG